MPGVPTSRGCEACRRSKKACDQTKPSCSRCIRLKLTCVGPGEKRWTFRKQKIVSKKPKTEPTKELRSTKDPNIQQNPTNECMVVAAAFVSLLEITDLTSHVVPSYGRFFKDIPRRLGENDALDAAVSALAVGFQSLRTHEVTPDMLKQYGRALKNLRICLADPIKANTADTLCTIYLITLCQKFFWKRGDPCLGHGEAMSHILNSRVSRGKTDGFDGELVVTVGVTVLLEMVFNPNIRMDPSLWNKDEIFGPPDNYRDGRSIEALTLNLFAKLPRYIQGPESYLGEIKLAYQQILKELPRLCRRLATVRETTLSIAVPVMRLYASCLLLALAIIFNDILQAFDPLNDLLIKDSACFISELMVLAEEVTQVIPMGAGYMPVCLIAIWATTKDALTLARVENMVLEYQAAALDRDRWFDIAIWTESRLRRLRGEFPLNETGDTWEPRLMVY